MVITGPVPSAASPGVAVFILVAMALVVYMSSPSFPDLSLHIDRIKSNPGPYPNPHYVPIHPADQGVSMARTSEIPTIPDPTDITHLTQVEGDLNLVPEEPVLEDEAAFNQVDVMVNFRIARQPNGHNAIRVFLPEGGVLTAAQAHWLHLDLVAASKAVSDVRTQLGYEA